MSSLERWLTDPVRFARLRRWSIAVLVLVLAAEIALPLLVRGDHAHFAFERFPGWGSVYGFVSCIAIVVVSKLLGKLWLMRREDTHER